MLRKLALSIVLVFGSGALNGAGAAGGTFTPIAGKTTAPIGYVQFCRDQPADCGGSTSDPRDVVLTKRAMRDLQAVNDAINRSVEPITDEDLYGTVELWAYPTAGRGDCEDYVLMKRRTLIEAGWPASALLITVVRDKKGDGHAVLTVKTDKGEFILDNQETSIKRWNETGYRYIKRQSQTNPDAWVSLGDTVTTSTAASGQ